MASRLKKTKVQQKAIAVIAISGPTEVYEKTGYRLNLCNHFPVEFMGSFTHFWVILNKILKMRKLFLFLKSWSHHVFNSGFSWVTKPDTHWVKTCPSQVRSQWAYSFSQTCLSRHIHYYCSQHGDDRNAHLEGSKQDFRHLLYFLCKLKQSFDKALTALSYQPVLIIIITQIKSIILISVLVFLI